jgi:glycosyltransferase involved in cell wall biosynthesis
MKKDKILMLHRIFTDYRKPIYDKLDEKYDFLLLHSDKEKTIKQVKTPYSKIIKTIQYKKGVTNLIFENFSYLFSFKPKAFIHESAVGIATTLPSYLVCKLLGIKFLLYGHGYNRFQGYDPKHRLSDKYRAFLMYLADAVIVYTQSDKLRLSHPKNAHKFFVAQNTLDTRHLFDIRCTLEQQDKAQMKSNLDFSHPYNLTFIGRLIEEKMPEKILDIFEYLQEKMPNQIGIHFIGEGDIQPLKDRISAKGWENNIHFHGAIYDEEQTGKFLFASDMMIMPGYLGLAVNHAFSFDCPVISFAQTENGPFHSPEIEYVANGETGFLVPNLSVEAMATTIEMYLKNPALQAKMKKNIRHKMEYELTIDNMVKGFTDAIDFVLNKEHVDFETSKVDNTGVLTK